MQVKSRLMRKGRFVDQQAVYGESRPSCVDTAPARPAAGPKLSSPRVFASLWGNTLQENPGMAGTVATDALDQGLVGTLSADA